MLVLLERRGSNLHPLAQRLTEPRRDRAVHPIGIDRPHSGLFALVDVLSPHGHPHHSFAHPFTTSRRSTAPRSVCDLHRTHGRELAPWGHVLAHTTSRGATWKARSASARPCSRRRRASLARVLFRRCAECAQPARPRQADDGARRAPARCARSRSTRSPARSSRAGHASSTRSSARVPRMRKRWLRVWVAEHSGPGLGPIEVVQVGDDVRDPRRPPPRVRRARPRCGHASTRSWRNKDHKLARYSSLARRRSCTSRRST